MRIEDITKELKIKFPEYSENTLELIVKSEFEFLLNCIKTERHVRLPEFGAFALKPKFRTNEKSI